MTIPEYITEQLARSGVKYVFGVPGGPSIPYIEAFRAGGIEFILTSHEAGAAIMADVTSRLTGVPGVCHGTFGPGATNLTTGAGLSLLDRSPVLIFTSEMPDSLEGRTVQMKIDHQLLFSAVTKKSFRLSSQNAGTVIRQALAACYDEYPGPVHIGLPSDLAYTEAAESFPEPEDFRDEAPYNDVNSIIGALGKARRPLLAVGLTAARFGLKKKISDFLANYPMAVVLTPMAKGLLDTDHVCYGGVLFHALSDCLEDIFQKTDLVIGLGYDQVEYNYESWIPDVPLVRFNVKDTDLPARQDVLKYTGSPSEWFELLRNLNQGQLILESAVLKGIRDEMKSVFNGFMSHFGPVSALSILKEELPQDAIVTADVGSHLHVIGQFWEPRSPERLLITNGWSSMGFGIPAAVAAALNSRSSQVFCITGDGGFLMSSGELMTARRLGLSIKVVVFSDGELNLIKLKQSWKDVPQYATTICDSGMFLSDSYLGIRVMNAGTSDEMRECVRLALQMKESVIINAVIDPEDYRWLVVRQK